MIHRSALGIVTLVTAGLAASPGARFLQEEPSAEPDSPTPIGVWDLRGAATNGSEWVATLVLGSDEVGGLAGYVDWIGSTGSSGRESFEGAFDPETGVVSFVGTEVVFSDDIARCQYEAVLSEDGGRLEQGRWIGYDSAAPGSWHAERIELP